MDRCKGAWLLHMTDIVIPLRLLFNATDQAVRDLYRSTTSSCRLRTHGPAAVKLGCCPVDPRLFTGCPAGQLQRPCTATCSAALCDPPRMACTEIAKGAVKSPRDITLDTFQVQLVHWGASLPLGFVHRVWPSKVDLDSPLPAWRLDILALHRTGFICAGLEFPTELTT